VLDKAFAHEALRGFYKESVQGVSGLILPKNISSSTQKSRLSGIFGLTTVKEGTTQARWYLDVIRVLYDVEDEIPT